ncbi:hypothetical protein [Actinoalloteichus fjordicus]|uniref:Uncharacterized protein n=1 Tax=Actinoalloteichus fjordicus TaxID=1612552 RepID=A0AAC9L8E2_9PSEU|nr:hypothetical protein [Actinoalloteichus fjordicus]APU12972.1 hypothetical protein UA74_04465 [Actinoalloteichus fjordicus]
MTIDDSTTLDELPPADRDREPDDSQDATRCLSAAAHLDADFAELAIEHYLGEPRRSLPPSPGVDSAAVLQAALTARSRRLLRDVALLALLLLMGILDSALLFLWGVLVGAGYLARTLVRAAEARTKTTALRDRGRHQVKIVLVAAGLLPLALLVVDVALGTAEIDVAPQIDLGVVGPLLVLATFGILLADQLVVDRTLKSRLRRHRFGAAAPAAPMEPETATSPTNTTPAETPTTDPSIDSGGAAARHRGRLETIRQNQRTADAGDGMTHNNITVYAGERAFVGSGDLDQAWSMALQLVPAEPAAGLPREPLRPRDLYRAVDEEMRSLRESDALAPNLRLRTIAGEPQAIVSAAALLRHRRDRLATAILPSSEHMPASSMPEEELNNLADGSREWIRHYQCFRVESWDRQLVISVFLHIGCDDKTLYIEWNSFRLTPIDDRFTSDDWQERTVLGALGRAARSTLLLPGSIARRVAGIGRYLGELIGPRHRPTDEHTFGAAVSLRELAATGRAGTYFQESDSFRYRKILQHRALAAISTHLRQRGFSTTELHRRSNTVIDDTMVDGGAYSGFTMIGQKNKITVVPTEPTEHQDKAARA